MDNFAKGNISIEELTESFVKKYSIDKEPISISFRMVFPEMNRIDRYTHLIHSYPAKLLSQIPFFFLNNSFFTKEGDIVLDPFCGTGTVLLEANIAGRNALGADANPLARLIANVKTTKLNTQTLVFELEKLLNKASTYSEIKLPEVINRDFWFSKKSQNELGRLYKAIQTIQDENYRSFFEVCFSNCVKKVSYADPRISVPVKLNPDRFTKGGEYWIKTKKRLTEMEFVDVFNRFQIVTKENINRIDSLNNIKFKTFSQVISNDARKLTNNIKDSEKLKPESVDFIITSPPYAGAQKYIRSSSLNLGWLDIANPEKLRKLDKQNIGRENYSTLEIKELQTGITSADTLLEHIYVVNPLRAHIVGNYLLEMMDALDESIRVLKRNSYLVIVIGNNKVCGYEFNTQEYLTEYIISKGLVLQFKLIDDIKSYGLMTKRNKTADIISREWVLVFKK